MQQANELGLDIRFDGRHLSRNELMRLIADADCYVSLHRAEGFGYTMAEAMFYGVPVIASDTRETLNIWTAPIASRTMRRDVREVARWPISARLDMGRT